MAYGLLKGKKGIITGALNDQSIAWKAALKAKEEGADIIESQTPIIPIYTHDALNTLTVAKELYDEGVYVNPVLPPAVHPLECLLRTSYMATHTEALLDEAADIIERVVKRHEQH